MSLLEGKVALITGASRGIGRVAASIMASEGADVAVLDINPDMEETLAKIHQTGQRGIAEVLDIANPIEVNRSVRNIIDKFGTVDILVNNAGIVNNIAPLKKMTYESWTWEVSVNLTGTFNMIKATIGPMIEKQWGRIINVSSGGAISGMSRQAAYAASKAGVLGLTKSITLEHARDGITCNAILPGMINTEMVQKMPQDIIDGAMRTIPAGRFGDMDDVGHLIAFLASDKSGYINGVELSIDGGGV
ncbi:MAG: SDR family oxidoreductase [Deltaproteobacteria bacterium]|jgi:NAD(P)-dependent dehydrogenase (short-subunit alcohol dehydrogenase family)|nr:SDR family oxidoreductase [Deltaproteobacteria bacterium]MBT4638157.1 SDR family oxidoreductase [Deltaproteobacteria bacterium]MBT6499463.1 SDR family oxidoreductase [Deltaproteobacteria bacterium]MBT7891660.1 SDR family oxidoreductase [Deltaproteobacteria bacterium]